jgi:uncharacterized membrane protein YheB (UPF0754 family)
VGRLPREHAIVIAAADIAREFRDHWPILLSIPVTAALIGWVTKLLAIKMLFWPEKFIGVGPIGWQGMVPRRTAKMMTIAADAIIGKLIDPREMLDRVDPRLLATQLEEPLVEVTADFAREYLTVYRADIWDAMPDAARRVVLARVRARAPDAIVGILADVREDVDGVFDPRFLIVANAVRNKAVMTRLMQGIATPELQFMVRMGLVFGAAIGAVQMLAWAATRNHLIMPLFGGFVGLFTDYTALQMIFVPRTRKRYLGLFPWQGLFFKRRAELSRAFAKVAAEDMLSVGTLIESLLDGPVADRIFFLAGREAQTALDVETGPAQPLVELAIGSERYLGLKRAVIEHARSHTPRVTDQLESFANDTFDVENTIAEKMQIMDEDDYEAVLRPMFKDDEWLIVVLGSVLGFLVGELQVLIITHIGG